MKSNNNLSIWQNRIEKMVEKHPLQIISWEATRKCNLNCKHCGSPSENVQLQEELTTKEVINAFKQIEEDFDMSQFRHINITGGEPFVRKDLFYILEQISQSPHYRNIDIQTNGMVLGKNPDLIEKLKQFGVTGIGISIDGDQEAHDALRRMNGSYKLAVKAAKSAVDSGLVVTVSTVAHAKNFDQIPKLYETIKKEVKPRVFRVMTLDPLGRADLNKEYLLSSCQTKHVIEFLQKTYAKNCHKYSNPKETMIELGCGGWLGKEIEGTLRPFIFHCVAGINNLGILYDGKLAACSNIPRELGFEGDLRIDRIKDIWDNKYQKYRNFKWKKTRDCQNCGEWDYCHGGPMHKMKKNGTRTDCIYKTINLNENLF
jgi:radical SAM protein with 4Fe4S-binding SPASM domain